ncbi:MAG: thermonuclease family protein [Candidatus Magasanikbacteria bacterium]
MKKITITFITLLLSFVLIGASCSNAQQNQKNPDSTTTKKQVAKKDKNSTSSKNQPKSTTTKEKTQKDTTQTLSTGDKTAKKEAERADNNQKLAKNTDKQKIKKKAKKEALGCTDPEAKNYNPNAIEDDGSCSYVKGCTDKQAKNYNPQAVKSDGSCKYVKGCTDKKALNYNPKAVKSDGSCKYTTGCTNPEASNYDPEAIKDDGSCIIKGCTDPEATNYNPDANKSDGSCKYAQKTYEVTRVVDGDTIEINYNGSEEKVRLIGLDTTESKDPRKKVQCFSKEASSQMRQLVSGKEVKLEQGPMSDNRGYYGRLLRYVYLPNGTHVNAWMIKQGYGYSYTKYPHSKQSQFEQYEKEARENKRGLWADGVCEKEEVTTEDSSTTSYTCSRNKYNCSDFDTYSKAKEVYEACGGVENDVHRLDGDNNGEPCESLK